jgi:phosphoribosyl 1,2-cyclic phosphodiesterase
VELRCADRLLICDSGTGIRELGMSLAAEYKDRPIDADLFISHTHWDHIQGFPFFMPAYMKRNSFRVHSVKSVGADFEYIFRGQMGQNYFPVEINDMSAKLEFLHSKGDIQVGAVKVRTIFTNHPGVNLAFRFEGEGASVTYLTDHENHQAFSGPTDLALRQDRSIEDFCRETDLLICDSQYSDEEYRYKRGWGHNRWKDALSLGLAAGVKRLALYHHDPTRTDDALDDVVDECRRVIQESGRKIECFAAREGQTLDL